MNSQRGRLVRVMTLATVVLALPERGAAQSAPTLELAAGVSVVRNHNVFEGTRPGWLLATGWNFAERVGVALEVGQNSASQTLGFLTADTRTTAVMVGPQVSWVIGPVRAFARVFGGAARRNVDIATTGLLMSAGSFASTNRAVSVGGGIELPVLDRIAFRAAYDLRRVFVTEPYSEHRVLLGMVYALHE